MGKSALMRCDDPIVLVTFEKLTERLWIDERQCGWCAQSGEPAG
jgi:hypothetical protein